MNTINHIAYIDGANLHNGTVELGWKLDYRKFRVWLSDKYGINVAKIFIGKVSGMDGRYALLIEAGFELVFKRTKRGRGGSIKGNCDAELIVAAMSDHYEKRADKATIVSSDGDFACLVDFLKSKGPLIAMLSPRDRCSFLLRRLNVPIIYLSTQRTNLEHIETELPIVIQKEKAPGGDGTPQGSSS